MVKIDTVVNLQEESKKLIKECSKRSLTVPSDKIPEKRFKIVQHPHQKEFFDSYIFSTYYVLANHPIICVSIFSTLLILFGIFGPTFCYVKCVLHSITGIGNRNFSTNYCSRVYAADWGLNKNANEYNEQNKAFQDVILEQCLRVHPKSRLNCITQIDPTEQDCIKRECCWSNIHGDEPHCYYPSKFKNYKYINVSATDAGAEAYLQIIKKSSYPNNVDVIKISFNYWKENMLEIKIYDPKEKRYEPPFPELPPLGPKAATNVQYVVYVDKDMFGFQIVRKSNNKTIFSTQDVGGFVFSDQLIQLAAHLPSNKIYGLGQQRNQFLLNLNWTTITLFNHDQQPRDHTNLYGTHPFYITMEEDGFSSGVLFLNSNAMDILLSPAPAITYRTIGGVVDLFVFLGPSPADVLRQYTQLVGRPFLPPYWSLGFHLCRVGYKTLIETKNVWNRTRAAKVPLDTQWNDLDYMKNGNDFTYDENRFEGLPGFVDLLHNEGMHYMVLLDPGVSAGELPGSYPPFDEGMSQRVFIMDFSKPMPFVGKVWNKESTVFVDFFKPATVPYWINQLRKQHNSFAFDGAWIDMNDPSNFLNGTSSGCPNTTLDHPPYLPGIAGQQIYFRTVCMSAKHDKDQPHYNLHNIYGLAEAIVTNFAMQQIRNKRAFVISRSSFPGLGKYAGVWTGDISSTWDDMAHSISDVLSFSLFGIPISGADICGFHGNASVSLCQRWSQLGAFYPFARNHNSDLSYDQDPVALGPAVVEAARTSLLIRYSLLPYLYTLLWHAHSRGDTVARPMFVEFPFDSRTHAVNTQFLWGPALLIIPVIKEGATNVSAYLPAGHWYDFYSGKGINSSGTDAVLAAPLDTIPLLLRGGYVIPTQRPELTTTRSRTNPIDLLVALNEHGHASGNLFWDDGDNLEFQDGLYNLWNFSVAGGTVRSQVQQWRYTKALLSLGNIRILGVNAVTQVYIGSKQIAFTYYADTEELLVEHLWNYVDLSKSFDLKWI